MATKPILPSEKFGLNTTPMLQARAAAGQNWKKGAVLTRAISPLSGYLIEAGADPTFIVGIAATDVPIGGGSASTTNSNSVVGFYPALPHVGFEGTVLVTAAQCALTETMLFNDYGLTADTTGNWYIDTAKQLAIASRVRIVELVDDTGTVDGRAVFVFLNTDNWLSTRS